MRVALIGGAGFIGSWLAKEFEDRGHTVEIIDPLVCLSEAPDTIKKKSQVFRKSLHRAKIEQISFQEYPNGALQLNPPDIVVHLAATPIDKPDSDMINKAQMTKDLPLNYHVIESMKTMTKTRFVFMSSIFAYGDHEWSVNEDAPLNPKTHYGLVKATGEFMTRINLDNWNIIRTTSVYGMGDWNWRGTQILINRLLYKEPIWVNDTWLDFIYIKDLVRGIADVALSDKKNEVFHISGGKAISLVEFAELLKEYFPEMNYDKKEIQDRPKRGTMDHTKARMLLGWEPKYSLKEGLADYMEYVRKEGFA